MEDTAGRFVVWNVWDNRDLPGRIPLIVKVLDELDGSVYALQELGGNEYPQIFGALGDLMGEPEWSAVTSRTANDGRSGFFKAGNRSVWWRPSKWEHVKHRSITLQPDDRQVPAVLLRSRATGRELWFYSVHLSHTVAKDDERDDQARQLVPFLASLGPEPKIGGGDINDTGFSVRDILRKAGHVSALALGKSDEPTHGDRRLDEVFADDVDLVEVTVHEVGRASDHRALRARWRIPGDVTPPPRPKYLGPFQLLTPVWAVQHNPTGAKNLPKDGTRKPYGKAGHRPAGFVLRNVVKLVQAKDSAGKEHTYAVTETGNRYAMGDSPNRRNWVKEISK